MGRSKGQRPHFPFFPKGSSKPGSIKKKHDKLDSDVDWKCIIEQAEQLPIKRQREYAEDSPTRTPSKSPASPTVNSSGKGLEKRDLEADNTEEKRFTPIPFPSLNANLEELTKFNELMTKNEAYRSAILGLNKSRKREKRVRILLLTPPLPD